MFAIGFLFYFILMVIIILNFDIMPYMFAIGFLVYFNGLILKFY